MMLLCFLFITNKSLSFFQMDWNLIFTLFWLLISAGILVPGLWLLIDGKSPLTLIDVILQRFYVFGKLKNENPNKRRVLGDVPKSSFLHFYIFGLVINLLLFIIFRSAILLSTLFLCHISRRLYECLYVHRFGSNSTMSVIHYLVGLVHYPFVGLTILVDYQYSDHRPSFFTIGLSVFLFIIASYVQYRVHLTLAKIPRNENEIYPIPDGYWPFQYFSSPNYIAEIVLYISFWLISHHTASFLSLLIWVLINQSLAALLTHRWYRRHYGKEYPSNRYALIPFLV